MVALNYFYLVYWHYSVYEIAEISINSFFINYVVDDGWMNARDAAVVLSFGGLGLFMCGRLPVVGLCSEFVQKEFCYTVLWER